MILRAPSDDQFVAASFCLAVLAFVLLLFIPVVQEENGRGSVLNNTSSETVTPSDKTLVDQLGYRIAVILAIPAFIAAIPLFLRRTRARKLSQGLAAGLLVIGVMLGAASVGMFYIPSALAMVAAAARRSSLDCSSGP